MSDPLKVSLCRWRYDASFAYSMTYDEGTVDTLANALPIHERFRFPGHVDVVAGQLGGPRNWLASSINGYQHMSADELKVLLSRGWGGRQSLVVALLVPGSARARPPPRGGPEQVPPRGHALSPRAHLHDSQRKCNHEAVLPLVKQHYLACTYIDGSPNRDDFDLYKNGNLMVASGPIYRAYDWKPELLTSNLDLEFLRGSWLYETSHLAMWNVPRAHKCVTPEDLTRRFERLTELSKGRMWAAKPDDVIDYVLLRRAVRGEVLRAEPRRVVFELQGQWPVGVVNGRLSFRVSGLAAARTWEVSPQPAPISGGGLRAQLHGWAQQGQT